MNPQWYLVSDFAKLPTYWYVQTNETRPWGKYKNGSSVRNGVIRRNKKTCMRHIRTTNDYSSKPTKKEMLFEMFLRMDASLQKKIRTHSHKFRKRWRSQRSSNFIVTLVGGRRAQKKRIEKPVPHYDKWLKILGSMSKIKLCSSVIKILFLDFCYFHVVPLSCRNVIYFLNYLDVESVISKLQKSPENFLKF